MGRQKECAFCHEPLAGCVCDDGDRTYLIGSGSPLAPIPEGLTALRMTAGGVQPHARKHGQPHVHTPPETGEEVTAGPFPPSLTDQQGERVTEAPGRTLEERVAAIEAAMWPLEVTAPEEWTPDQVADFEDRLRREMGDEAWKRHEIRLVPPAPALTPETARAFLRECVTVVRPGETLVIRVPDTWTTEQAELYQEHADAATEAGRIPFKVLVVLGEELAVVQPEPADMLARRIKGILPGLLAEEHKRTARVASGQAQL